MADAIKIFQAKTLQVGKQVLEKQGYSYKGVSSDEFGKDYNWVKNMNLTSDVPYQLPWDVVTPVWCSWHKNGKDGLYLCL